MLSYCIPMAALAWSLPPLHHHSPTTARFSQLSLRTSQAQVSGLRSLRAVAPPRMTSSILTKTLRKFPCYFSTPPVLHPPSAAPVVTGPSEGTESPRTAKARIIKYPNVAPHMCPGLYPILMTIPREGQGHNRKIQIR